MATATASGKIILFGEHAVVYGFPAIAVPVRDVQVRIHLSPGPEGHANDCLLQADDIQLESWMSDLPQSHPLRRTWEQIRSALQKENHPPIRMHISSSIPIAAGLGSGAAISIAMTRALSTFFQHPLEQAKINQLAFEIEKIHHGTPSGIDNTVICYEQPVYFIREQSPRTFQLAAPVSLVISDSGQSSPTSIAVTRVREAWQTNPLHMQTIFRAIGELTNQAYTALQEGNHQELGPLMNQNHALLRDMGVSNDRLDELVSTACSAGAKGAKLSGAGLGGNIIALVQPADSQRVATALTLAGARACIQTEV